MSLVSELLKSWNFDEIRKEGITMNCESALGGKSTSKHRQDVYICSNRVRSWHVSMDLVEYGTGLADLWMRFTGVALLSPTSSISASQLSDPEDSRSTPWDAAVLAVTWSWNIINSRNFEDYSSFSGFPKKIILGFFVSNWRWSESPKALSLMSESTVLERRTLIIQVKLYMRPKLVNIQRRAPSRSKLPTTNLMFQIGNGRRRRSAYSVQDQLFLSPNRTLFWTLFSSKFSYGVRGFHTGLPRTHLELTVAQVLWNAPMKCFLRAVTHEWS